MCAGARIGEGVSLGQNVFVGNKVVIGDRCKVQNNVSVYDNVTLEEGVFCGPSMVFTNVYNSPFVDRAKGPVPRHPGQERRDTLGPTAPLSAGLPLVNTPSSVLVQ
ncbi:UDP-2-acetamido-3-amino-2,3-dideoxy-d-glucuronic acid N-acetyltransferase, WbpD [Pseudomonas putida S11]|nr:UDP-2-acetamido-3-amino-2,3-dideoxy-d-glucuronic acid N-acetyltransferase, WbpD [Pseudomonas putida S11]